MPYNNTRTIKLQLPLKEYGIPPLWGRPDQLYNWHNLPREFARNFPDPSGQILAWKAEEDKRPWQLYSIFYCIWQDSKTSESSWGLLNATANHRYKTEWSVLEVMLDPPPYAYACQLYDHRPSNKEIDSFLSGAGMWWQWLPEDWRLVAGKVCEEIWQDLIGECSLSVLEPRNTPDL